MKRIALCAVIITLLAGGSSAHSDTSAEETIVFVVRHAEKASDDRDPLLSERGTTRASALARVLAHSGIDAIYTTQYQRTRLTAAPLAQLLGVEATVIEASATHTDDIAAKIRSSHRGERILVVGHSNTVPPILAALGVSNPPSLTDDDYDRLYIVTLRENGKAGLLTLHYGE